MTVDTTQRMTISLPSSLAHYLDEYQKSHGVGSRSEAMAHAIRALREQQLAEEYAALAQEHDPDRTVFLEGYTDGFEAGDGGEWR